MNHALPFNTVIYPSQYRDLFKNLKVYSKFNAENQLTEEVHV